MLPAATYSRGTRAHHPDSGEEILRGRDHSLLVRRDFDVSPNFEIVKPSLIRGFDYHALAWAREG